jgi:hypothetical protein
MRSYDAAQKWTPIPFFLLIRRHKLIMPKLIVFVHFFFRNRRIPLKIKNEKE